MIMIKDLNTSKLNTLALEPHEIQKLILENTNELIAILNDQFEHEYINKSAYYNILGYTENEVLGKKPKDFAHPDDMNRVINAIKNGLINGESTYEFRIKHKEGHYIWMETKGRFFIDETNKFKTLFISRNIRERKLAEERLKESEEKYRNLYENSPNGIILLNEEGIILEANNAAGLIFGYQIPSVIGKNYRDLNIYTKNELKKIEAQYQDYLLGKKIKPIELQLKRGDGKIACISHQMSVIKSDENILIETIAHDVTEEKRAQIIIQEENKKLLELNKLKNELVSRVSHELKTPLNSIYGAAQILLQIYKKSMCNEVVEFIEMIHKGGKRLKALIEKLLDISSIESGKMHLNLRQEDLVLLIEECVNELNYLLKERGLNIELYLPDTAIVNVDKIRIEQVITNLLSNAIKNTPPNGNIIIKLTESIDSFYFSIKDTGVGLSEEDMNKL
ncbi:MAG: PAS domain-containing sensor histidine kinase, partial [Promethearchaeota archaeon]